MDLEVLSCDREMRIHDSAYSVATGFWVIWQEGTSVIKGMNRPRPSQTDFWAFPRSKNHKLPFSGWQSIVEL
jgi:hypothetical protein